MLCLRQKSIVSMHLKQGLKQSVSVCGLQDGRFRVRIPRCDLKSLLPLFSHDVTAAILVFQNNKTAAMLVSQTSPVGFELFSYGYYQRLSIFDWLTKAQV